MTNPKTEVSDRPLYMLTFIASACWSNWQLQFDRFRDGGFFMQLGPFGFSLTLERRP